jgi:hypothetical protein
MLLPGYFQFTAAFETLELTADAPQWDGKTYKRVKSGDRFDFRTVEGQERAAQIRERRLRFAGARRAEEMKAEMY